MCWIAPLMPQAMYRSGAIRVPVWPICWACGRQPRLVATRDTYTWIHKYVFPGGMLPSVEAIGRVLRGHTTLHASNIKPMGQHYAHTLRMWREQFVANWQHVEELGFDDRFFRMWEFYLAYCEAGFRTGYLDVAQIRIER